MTYNLVPCRPATGALLNNLVKGLPDESTFGHVCGMAAPWAAAGAGITAWRKASRMDKGIQENGQAITDNGKRFTLLEGDIDRVRSNTTLLEHGMQRLQLEVRGEHREATGNHGKILLRSAENTEILMNKHQEFQRQQSQFNNFIVDRFGQIDRRFAEVDRRFTETDRRFDEIIDLLRPAKIDVDGNDEEGSQAGSQRGVRK